MPTFQIVNCRIGSLEKQDIKIEYISPVNCRIGSLEKCIGKARTIQIVNCRIGSLEKQERSRIARAAINCRIGSLGGLIKDVFLICIEIASSTVYWIYRWNWLSFLCERECCLCVFTKCYLC